MRVPRSQRGGEVCKILDTSLLEDAPYIFPLLMQSCFYQIIEPLVSKQWFVTMEPLAEKALQAVEKGELTIMPERFEKVCNIIYHFLCSSFVYLIFPL